MRKRESEKEDDLAPGAEVRIISMMRTIAAFFDAPRNDEYPFSIPLYRTVYGQLGAVIKEKGGWLYVVRSQQTYVGGNTFAHAWKWHEGTFVDVKGPFTPDLIWNKASLRSDADAHVLNDPIFDRLATNKWETYMLFPDLHAKTCLVQTAAALADAFHTLSGALLISKPLEGFGGEGIIVGSREQLRNHHFSFPCIVQEFVDTSGGIPGIVDGLHDLRVIMLGSEIGLSYIRTPPPGGFLANVSRGGQEVEVKKEQIPAAALALAYAVDRKLKHFTRRIYSIDMGLGLDGRWRLFELNTKPGFSPMEDGESYPAFYHMLAEYLLRAATP